MAFPKTFSSIYMVLALVCFCGSMTQGWAQDLSHSSDSSAMPDAPSAVISDGQAAGSPQPAAQQSPNTANAEGKQTKRILGIVPNFRSVSADVKLPPQSVKDKLKGTMQDSFDYSSFIFVGGLAGVSMAQNSYPEFHQGAAGYGRYYWHAFADQTNENIQVEFLWPVAFRQDPRYYTMGHGGLVKRTAYSFSRILITRTDGGRETFNISEVGGAGAAAGISDLYYPGSERTWTKTGQRWATNVGLDGLTFIVKEFWPDINDKIFHQKD
jgi:hypothetical protein